MRRLRSLSTPIVLVAVVIGLIPLAAVPSCSKFGPAVLIDEGADLHLDNRYNDENHTAILEYLDKSIVEPQPDTRVFSAYHILGSSSNRIYVWAVSQACRKGETGELERGSGASLPVALAVEVKDAVLTVTGHKCPRDGPLYGADVRSLFPPTVPDQVFGIHQGEVVQELRGRCDARARRELGIPPPPPEWRFLVEGSEPAPAFAALLDAAVYRSPGAEILSPDGRYILGMSDGLVALPLFSGGSPTSLYSERTTTSSSDYISIRPVGWACDTECLFVTLGLQQDGPHEGSRGAALFSGDIVEGRVTEIAYFDCAAPVLKAVEWDQVSRKVYLHVPTAIWEMDIEKKQAREVRSGLPSNDGLFHAIPSPDGTKFAYDTPLQGRTALSVLDCRTGKETTIHPDGDAMSFYPLWSPDGRYVVAYYAGRKQADDGKVPGEFELIPDEDGPWPAAKGLVMYDTGTGSSSTIRIGDRWLTDLKWSPDSGTLFFASASIRFDPAHPQLETTKVDYDSVWATGPCAEDSLERVADMSSSPAAAADSVRNSSLSLALPNDHGILFVMRDSQGPSLWLAARGREPSRFMATGFVETLVSAHGDVVMMTSAEKVHEIWSLQCGDAGPVAKRIVRIANADWVSMLAYTGKSLVVKATGFEPEVSAIVVYEP